LAQLCYQPDDPATSLQQRWVAAAVLLLAGQDTATRQLTSLLG